ncbi:methyltransferase domain-containing protein [Acidisoma cladoniae]|uniref:methyltransferase domain-containing protein n=1 Tax=Acidisoma cladoniae TaxID=3040935 RepID=UPI00254B73FB|nr:methyltransferase domain-containing protein [Acidisoma sp. PAMC 29798]
MSLTQDAPVVTSYPDNLNPDLLDRIPADAKVVLDVGCHMGLLGAVHRRRNPRVRYLGVDTDIAALRVAATRLSEVALLDVETGPLPFEVPGGYDCIIYGDVLEHLKDPWRILREHAALLSETGVMLICVPNVGHWSVARRLIDGTFDYDDSGILDRTHLRWFTQETMRKALLGAGLTLCDVTARIFDREGPAHFADAIAETLARLGVSRESYISRSAPLQYVWRARRVEQPRFAVRGTMLSPYAGVSDIRVIHPFRALQTDASVIVQVGELDKFPQPTVDLPAICILHRPLLVGEEGLAIFRYLLRRGFLVVTEFDDLPDFLPGLRDDNLMNFRAAHAVQTSTNVLAETLREQNPEVRVFRNGIMQLMPPMNFKSNDTMTLFFGALNRQQDWEPYMPALNAAAAALGSRLQFSVVNDQAFFEALETPHKSFTPLCDYQTYVGLLAQCEISFMPLRDTPFNRAKSDLKFIEAGGARAVALASPIVYAGSIEDGVNGLIFRDGEELYDRLVRLVQMPALALPLAESARHLIATTRMDAYQMADRVLWYRSLIQRRDVLTRALLERVPALAT